MMLVAGLPPSVSSPRLLKAFKALEKKFALQVNIKPISASLAHSDKQPPPQYMLSVYGSDKPGIVYKVTQALAARRVSITDLNTKAVGRGAAALYVMLLEIQMPRTLDLDALRSELDDLKKNLQVEMTLQDIEAIAL
jgi:glycine cleavage system transcriptional repressor